MAFKINFLNETVPKEFSSFGEPATYAEITIGDFSERIIVETGYWSPDQYRKQWADAIERLLSKPGNTKSALIVGMCDPLNPRFEAPVEVWSLFRRGDTVLVHNQHNSIKNLPKPFDSKLEDFYASMEYGNGETSEWQTTTSELKKWLDELKAISRPADGV